MAGEGEAGAGAGGIEGLSAEESAQFAEMQAATSGGGPSVDDGAAQDAGADGQSGEQGAGAGAQGEAGAAAGASAAQGVQGQQGGQQQAGQEGAQGAGEEEGQDWRALWPYNPHAAKPRRISLSKAERIWKDREDALKERDTLRAELDQAKLGGAKVEERLRILNEAILARGGQPQQPGAGQQGQQQPGAAQAKPGQQQGQDQDDDPEPDPDKDIFEHNKWLRRQLAKTQQFMADFAQGYQDERQGAEANRSLNTAYVQDIAAFSAKEPAFNDARKHLMESRVIDLAMFYFGRDVTEPGATLSPEEFQRINNTIIQEERGIVQQAMGMKMSPAARVFALAKARGWRPQAAAAGDGQQQQQNGAGAAAAGGAQGAQQGQGGKPTASAKPPGALDQQGSNGGQQVNVADEINRIRDGQAASVSLSDGGGSPQVPLTIDRLARMSDAEFAKYADTFTDEDWKQLGG